MSILLISTKRLIKNQRSQQNKSLYETKSKGNLLSSFIISHFSYCPLIWLFCSKKSTKKINAVHERSLRIIRNDYESLYPLLLEEAHQITFQQL